MKKLRKYLTSLLYLLFMTAVTGLLYPLAVTLVSQSLFPSQAGGGMIVVGKEAKGSRLIGQEFKTDRFFQGRPSCSSYDTMAAGASNLATGIAALKVAVGKSREEWRKKYGDTAVPEEMLYASASGLDPEISPEAALLQLDRVANARGYGPDKKNWLREYIKYKSTSVPLVRIPRVNVLELNLMLEEEDAQRSTVL